MRADKFQWFSKDVTNGSKTSNIKTNCGVHRESKWLGIIFYVVNINDVYRHKNTFFSLNACTTFYVTFLHLYGAFTIRRRTRQHHLRLENAPVKLVMSCKCRKGNKHHKWQTVPVNTTHSQEMYSEGRSYYTSIGILLLLCCWFWIAC